MTTGTLSDTVETCHVFALVLMTANAAKKLRESKVNPEGALKAQTTAVAGNQMTQKMTAANIVAEEAASSVNNSIIAMKSPIDHAEGKEVETLIEMIDATEERGPAGTTDLTEMCLVIEVRDLIEMNAATETIDLAGLTEMSAAQENKEGKILSARAMMKMSADITIMNAKIDASKDPMHRDQRRRLQLLLKFL
jgi:hypothetical protein